MSERVVAVFFSLLVGVVLIVFTDKAGDAIGIAAVGGAIALAVEAMIAVRTERERQKTAVATDLSNTRMLIYIALASMLGESGASRASAAGTLAHALAYHSKLLTPEQAEDLAERIVIEQTASGKTGDELRALAETITERLDEA